MFGKKEKKVILLVDQFEQNREYTKTVLEGAGYNVIVAKELKEALVVLNRKKINLIIAEVDLPHVSGIVFYKHLKKEAKTKHTPFLFITSTDNEKKILPIRPILRQYQDTAIFKPVQWKTGLEQIEALIARESSAHEESATPTTAHQEQTGSTPSPTLPKTNAVKTSPGSSASAQATSPHPKTSAVKTSPRQSSSGQVPTTTRPKTGAVKATGTAKKMTAKQNPNEPKIIDLQGTKVVLKRKKKVMILVSSPQGCSTKNFSAPKAKLDTKQFKGIIAQLFRSFKKGKPLEIVPIKFEALEFQKEGLREKIRQQVHARRIDLQELLTESEEQSDFAPTPVGTSITRMGNAQFLSEENILLELEEDQSKSSTPEVTQDMTSNGTMLSDTEEAMIADQINQAITQKSSEPVSSIKEAREKDQSSTSPSTPEATTAGVTPTTPSTPEATTAGVTPVAPKIISRNIGIASDTQQILTAFAYSTPPPNIFVQSFHYGVSSPENQEDSQFEESCQEVFNLSSVCLHPFDPDSKATEIILKTDSVCLYWLHDEVQKVFILGAGQPSPTNS